MTHGLGRSAETLAIEGELAQVQGRAAELHSQRQELIRRVQVLGSRRDLLQDGVAEAEAALAMAQQQMQQQQQPGTRGNSGDREVAAINSAAAAAAVTVGADGSLGDIGEADDRIKKFYGIIPRDQQQQQQLSKSTAAAAVTTGEVKTVRMVKRDSKERSVSRSGASNEEEEEEEEDADTASSTGSSTKPPSVSPPPPPPPPPPPLPGRGNYQTQHDFLKKGKETANAKASGSVSDAEPKRRGQIETPVASGAGFSSASLPRKFPNGSTGLLGGGETGFSSGADSGVFGSRNTLAGGGAGNGTNLGSGIQQLRANFKLGDYYKTAASSSSSHRPGSALSAHERLFGSSRESSMSPPTSPASGASGSKYGSQESNSNLSAMQSPVFKSDTARRIAQEIGKVGGGGRRRSGGHSKQRSHTISGGSGLGGNPAVAEALRAHQAKMASRSRDDLDMERALHNNSSSSSSSSSTKGAPDVVRSAIKKPGSGSKKAKDGGAAAIDTIFGAPDKIDIPERYVPDTDMDNVTPEERKVRLKKADSIRKMLADTGGGGMSGEQPHAKFPQKNVVPLIEI